MILALSRQADDLRKRIDLRVDDMFRRGLVAETGQLLRTFAESEACPAFDSESVALSSDGRRVAVGTRHGVVCVRDVGTSRTLLWQTQSQSVRRNSVIV